jgi:hypothetical protein
LDDDIQFANQYRRILRHHCRLARLNYFLAGSTAFVEAWVAVFSLLTGAVSAFFSTLQVLSLAGSHFAGAGAEAATTGAVAGAAGFAGSVAKADTATRPAIKVTIDFMINFLLVNVQKLIAVHIYNAIAQKKVYKISN